MAATLLGGLLIFSGVLRPVTVAAREATGGSAMPESPAPGYTPRFVTQTDERPPWDDCLWAAGSMLLDKWTEGRIQPDRVRLRRASGDFVAGSRFSDFARAVSRIYGWRPKFSPDGGDPMTWNGLLDRLESGGGAIVAGDYGDLGNPYIRWDRNYAAARNASGHAMYVERYDSRSDRLWLMDPLGRGGYRGEWISSKRLHAFIWQRRGLVHAAATPPPPATSTIGYLPGALALDGEAHRAGDSMKVSVAFVKEGPWPLPSLTLSAAWEQVAPDADAAVALAVDFQSASADPVAAPLRWRSQAPLVVASVPPDTLAVDPLAAAPVARVLSASGQLAIPQEPGLWRLTASIQRGDGRSLPDSWRLEAVDVRVWGDRGAVVTPVVSDEAALTAGQPVQVTILVEDAGTQPWTSARTGPDLGEDMPATSTELQVRWADTAGKLLPAAIPLTLTSVSGQEQAIALSFPAPRLPGRYELRVDVRDGQGSLLAPEARSNLVLVVGPAPVETIPPTQNQ